LGGRIQNVEDIDLPIKDYRQLVEANPDLDPEKLVISPPSRVSSFLTSQRITDRPIAASSTAASTSSIIRPSSSTIGPLRVTGAKTEEEREESNRLRRMLIARARALEVAISWRTKLINTGYSSQAYIDEFPSHNIYEIVEGQSIRLQNSYIGKNRDNSYNLIAYTNSYAAMLPIA